MRFITCMFVCSLVGAVFGWMLGNGENYYKNKTEKQLTGAATVYIFTILGAFVGIFGGIYIASKLEEEEKSNKEKERFGMSRESTECYKRGRYWVCETKWYDPVSNSNNSLSTGKNEKGFVTSIFNGKEFINHNVTSANQENVPSLHELTKQQVFASIIGNIRHQKEKERKVVTAGESINRDNNRAIPVVHNSVDKTKPVETIATSCIFLQPDKCIAAETSFTDSRKNITYVLLTSKVDSKIISTLNGSAFMEHGIRPADEKTITYMHDVARTTLFNSLGIKQVI